MVETRAMSKKNQKAKYQDQKAKAKYEDLKANYQRVFTEARKKQVKDLCPWWNLDEIFEAEDEEEKLNRAVQEEARDLFAEVKYVADFYKSNPKAVLN